MNNSTAQWVPTIRFGGGASDLSVPATGNYTLEWMLSDRVPQTFEVNATTAAVTALTVTLATQASLGSYTPLLAWGNAELRAISQRGNGTAINPYVLIHRAVGPLDPVFGQLNFFGFPVFAGVLLINTTANVSVVQPQVAITYGPWMDPQLAALGLPRTNDLQLEFWNVSDVAIVNCSGLSGWLSADLASFPVGEVLFWGSSGNLVANDTFHDQGAALTLYGGTGNTVWGNTFLPGAVSSAYYEGNNTTGVIEWESGDLLYNNFFGVGQPVITPTYDAFSCQVSCLSATYHDAWNVSREPANVTAKVLWLDLTGSILHTPYQGGNFWSNYGTAEDPLGVLPYNDHGLITVHGDYVPLYPTTVYTVTFAETGLEPGTAWNVTVLGVTNHSTAGSVVLAEGNGTYNYTVGAPANYLAPVGAGVVVNGTNVTVTVPFVQTFRVVIGESGLPAGWEWNVTFPEGHGPGAGVELLATGGAVAIGMLVNGSQPYRAEAYGFVAAAPTGSIRISGVTVTFEVAFSVLNVLRLTAEGVDAGAAWTVTVEEGATAVSASGIGPVTVSFTLLQIGPGGFSWVASASGYTAAPSHGVGTSPTEYNVTVQFSASHPAPPVNWSGLWLGIAVVLAIVGFALYLRERRRAPKPPRPMAPVTMGAAAESARPAGGPAPWEEGPSDSETSEPYRRPG